MSLSLSGRTTVIGLALALTATMSASVAAAASAATAPTTTAVSAPATGVSINKVRLYELTTKDNQGFFYTADEAEKDAAITKHGFKLTQTPLYYISRSAFPGGMPMWRLRYTGKSSYLVTASAEERDKLVDSGKFVNEGVIGYAADGYTEGTTKVWRLSNNHMWRLAVEAHMISIVNNEPGWRLDGPVLNHFHSAN